MVKRTNVLFIRLTDEEKRKLQDYARTNNMSLNMTIVTLINNLREVEK